MTMTTRLAAALLALLLAGCSRGGEVAAPAAGQGGEAWARLAAVPGRPAAAYLAVSARPGRADSLVAVTSPEVATIELHEMAKDGSGVMRMNRLDALPLPASGEPVRLEPGGRHLMLFGVDPGVQPGGVIDLHLQFASGRTEDRQARVIAAGDDAPAAPAAGR
jgi:periplasmic copper chaperone A